MKPYLIGCPTPQHFCVCCRKICDQMAFCLLALNALGETLVFLGEFLISNLRMQLIRKTLKKLQS
ncbi:hypothetical protein V6Z11_A10G073300 [Gossypium hirsutum]